MSLFPNILDISSYNTMLAQHQRLSTNHEHTAHNHHISEMVVDILSRVLAPASYLQCTSTIPCWAPFTTNAYAAEKSPKYVVDDDYVLLDDEDDGGPLCRETTIASWKARPAKKERSRSIQWLASVVRRDSH
jgi:hypothetical protein